jgi:hypothetical protein
MVNLGYVFINFTMGYAVLLLYYSLQGCHWKVNDSHKHIDIVLQHPGIESSSCCMYLHMGQPNNHDSHDHS